MRIRYWSAAALSSPIAQIIADMGKSSESVQCAMLKACDACADMGQL